MDVRCEKCDTLHQLDDARVTEAGVEVQCKKCAHRFRARRRPPVVTREMAGLQAVGAQLSSATPTPPPAEGPKDKGAERPWHLRLRRTQEVLRFRDLGMLRQWIMEKRVNREDDISRGGRTWRRLGTIVELEALFYSADQADKARMSQEMVRSTTSGRIPSQVAPLPSEPRRLRSDTPGMGVGPVLSPSQRAAVMESERSPVSTIIGQAPASRISPRTQEEAAPAASMRRSSTGRTMRPRLRQPSPVSEAATQIAKTSAEVKAEAPTVIAEAGPPATPFGAPPPAGVVPAAPKTSGTSGPRRQVLDPSIPRERPSRRPRTAGRDSPITAKERPAAPKPLGREDLARPAPAKAPSTPVRAPTSEAPSAPASAAPVAPLPVLAAAPRPAPEVIPILNEVIRRSDPVPQSLKEPSPCPTEPRGPMALEPSFGPLGASTTSPEPAAMRPEHDEDWEQELSTLRPRRRWLAPAAIVLVLCAFGGARLLGLPALIAKTATGRPAPGRGAAAHDSGLRYFLMDVEEDFQRAHDQFLRASGADEQSPAPLAALAELHACWAIAQREEARSAPAAEAALLTKDADRHLRQARQYADQALALSASAPEVNRAMALVLIETGDAEQQVDMYLQQAGGPDSSEVAFVRARLSLRQQRLEEARAWLDKAAAGQPPLLRALVLRAALRAQAGDLDGAARDLEQVLAMSPGHRRARAQLQALGRRLVAAAPPDLAPAQKVPAGRAAARPAERGDGEAAPQDFRGQLQRAQRLLERGRPREAQRIFALLADDSPDEPDVHVGLGACAAEMERYQAAVGHYQDALKLRADYAPALLGLGDAYKLRGDADKALRWYRRYLEQNPSGEHAQLARNNIERLEALVAARPPEPAAAPESPSPPAAPAPTP